MEKEIISESLKSLGIKEINNGATTGGSDAWIDSSGNELVSYSPMDGTPIARVALADRKAYDRVMAKATRAFASFRMMPAPKRGEMVREIGNCLREKKQALGTLIALETGKIKAEGLGEVQEMIDIADFAVGLSRQLYGLTMHSERPLHRMYEQWHPLGVVGIITAFNFPCAVWAWNALIAAVCGDACLFKPSSKTPLTAIAIQNIIAPVVDKFGADGIFNLIIGSRKDVGEPMLNDTRIPLISATGSTAMGKHVGAVVGERLGRTLLELGGNNAIIVTEDADMDMAVRATLFGAVGTAGQRCTSTRRIIVQSSVRALFVSRLVNAYKQVPIGNPLDEKTLMGPLIDATAVADMDQALKAVCEQGGEILYGGEHIVVEGLENGFYVTPAIVAAQNHFSIVQQETFAPILYIIEYESLDQAIELHNAVPQGLSSAIFTGSMHSQEQFLSHKGSDCGIANVNIGTSGAEIGGAFGGEKETGGGRESGSDAWKIYMRRQTNTINFGRELPLAQGIKFNIN
ncbi:MAG: aldehyde dehydrogenase family protein [Proteobacteria bacterium]|nr:aldehyde dehydrogenase family protein [Desulfobacula sp.]MBU3953302.1 aldehyde dehydrogenase family protein [Pseudomonadota bacterium]MBU4130640.1 aldehyde dehydrogenase family protein [Pseudomonadota bacterium]